jgi:hypothetical protein
MAPTLRIESLFGIFASKNSHGIAVFQGKCEVLWRALYGTKSFVGWDAIPAKQSAKAANCVEEAKN